MALAREFRVSRPTIDKVLNRARGQEFAPRKSTNTRFLQAKYGMKRLAKVEAAVEAKQTARARRENKDYPGEMIHFDTKRLPLLKGERTTRLRDYLFVGIDDCSRELYAGIFPDKTQRAAAAFLGRCWRNVLTPWNVRIQTMARNIKARQPMRLSPCVRSRGSDRNVHE